jgi:tryptophan-rich sensory protein
MASQPRRRGQVTFSPMQTHVKNFEYALIVICILCIIVGVVIAKATEWGVTTRP